MTSLSPVIDVNAWTGCWHNALFDGSPAAVVDSLRAVGVDLACLSPLNAAFCQNQHAWNDVVFAAAEADDGVLPVPILDPTIATWRAEVQRAGEHPCCRAVKLLPAYSPCELTAAAELVDACAKAGLAVIIQTRLEDPRRQHPLAQVPDIPAAQVADLAGDHPTTNIVIGGPRWTEIHALRERLLALPNLFADVSQADGLDSLLRFVDAGLTDKLLFGSHAPLFIPEAALARVVNDLDADSATAILGANAARLLRIREK